MILCLVKLTLKLFNFRNSLTIVQLNLFKCFMLRISKNIREGNEPLKISEKSYIGQDQPLEFTFVSYMLIYIILWLTIIYSKKTEMFEVI